MFLLTPEDLVRCDARAVEEIADRRDFLVSIAGGDLSGYPLAAALHSDFLVAADSATIELGGTEDSAAAAVWSGAIWRIGPRALRFYLLSGSRLTAEEALHGKLVDAVVAAGEDPVKWVHDWIGGRSTAALESAAALLRRRGGDTLERAEFARLFATGEPQHGLDSFLAKRRPQFIRDIARFRSRSS